MKFSTNFIHSVSSLSKTSVSKIVILQEEGKTLLRFNVREGTREVILSEFEECILVR